MSPAVLIFALRDFTMKSSILRSCYWFIIYALIMFDDSFEPSVMARMTLSPSEEVDMSMRGRED